VPALARIPTIPLADIISGLMVEGGATFESDLVKMRKRKLKQKGSRTRRRNLAPRPPHSTARAVSGGGSIARPGASAKGLAALEWERARLAAMVELSHDAIIMRNLDDIITDWNTGAERAFGYTAKEIVGRSFATIVPPEKRQEMLRIEEQILKGKHPEYYETTRVAKDGHRVVVSVLTAPILDTAGRVIGISTVARDITRQKQAEEALRQSERSLADFFTESPIGLLWVDPLGHVLRVNRAQLELLDRANEEVIGHLVKNFIAEEEIGADVLRRLAKDETLRDYRARVKQRNGTVKHVLIDANGLWEGPTLVHSRWFVRDISRRLELEREILAITEREQRRIGQDLHDDLGQQLAGIEFLTQTLVRQLSATSRPAAARANEIAGMVRRTMVRARELSRGLSPISLESDGLMVALRELAARTKKIFRVDCRFKCKGPVLIPDHNVGIHLYRIAQEAVSNAIKHGKASRIDIGLSRTSERIVLAVSDNGIGMPRKPRKKGGMGLRVMQYRAGVIDASLVGQRQPDGGTTFVCSIKETSFNSAAGKS
jgi:PAS domain S-box-containing protein